MRCCGSSYHEITMNAGSRPVALLRCSACGDQKWAVEGTVLPRHEAFDLLASAYRQLPVQARATRDRAAAARRAARAAGRVAAQAGTPPERESDAARLIGMLDGWQLLGATA